MKHFYWILAAAIGLASAAFADEAACAVEAAFSDEAAFADEAAAPPLTPVQARGKVGQEVTVEMVVQAAKDRLEKRGEIYLDSETDFRSEKNFAVVITKVGAALFKEQGIADPAEHFLSKTIRAKGTVKEVDDVPRIEIDDPKQVSIVEPK
jgi:hypothetical protein